MTLETKIKLRYPQPQNIHIEEPNIALREHQIYKEHVRLKYEAKHAKSKRSKRLYG